MEWGASGLPWPTPAAPVTSAALGKRRYDDLHRDEAPGIIEYPEPSQKRVRGGKANEVLEAARSVARTHHNAVARIPDSEVNGKPKEAGREAERLATPILQGLHYRPPLGPSFQQGLAVEAAEGQSTWVEGSVGAGAVQQQRRGQQQQQEEEKNKYFKIARKLKQEYRALLAVSQDNVIKCRLCPGTKLKKWEDFKRHCKASEVHPLEITFCEQCGDYFARTDALKRHRQKPPPVCATTSSERAAEKRERTERAHEEFKEMLKDCLRTGKDIGKPFSQRIKDMFPKSSKKQRAGGSREQSRLDGR